MYNFLVRNGQLLAFGIGTLFTVIFLIGIFSGLEGFNALAEEEQGTTSIFNFGLYAVAFMAVACVIALLAFSLYHMATDFKSARMGLIGVGVLAVLFFIARAISPNVPLTSEHLQDIIRDTSVTDTVSANIGGGIGFTLLLMGIAAAAFVFSEIRNFFK